jgi:uncharacterized protein YcaQ
VNVAAARARVLARALRPLTTLDAAIARLGFVQADPIRAPARAQDLVLRHRVADYRAGDLERHYPDLGLDEAFVYAYGFVPPATDALLHPRSTAAPRGLARRVLDHVAERGPTHPRALATALGTRRERNPWGGQSLATTRALERLHYLGHLRVARRERGIRVYEAARPRDAALPPDERLRRLTLLLVELFAPIPETSFRAILSLARYALPGVAGRATVVGRLLRTGAIERHEVDGVRYLTPPTVASAAAAAPNESVRFLAPFDPIVWDRRRVEHLWGWAYRFEAYTPAAKRQYGYYALPMLWRDALVGWANVSAKDGALDVQLGFVDGKPRDRAFARALDAEVERMRAFLMTAPAGSAP